MEHGVDVKIDFKLEQVAQLWHRDRAKLYPKKITKLHF